MSDTNETAADQILENAVQPKRVDIDGEEVEQHSIDDQIKAAKYAASVAAANSKHTGLRIFHMVHGGAE